MWSGKTLGVPTVPQPIAKWNSARDVWETPGTESIFCGHLAASSGIFPTSGMTANGAAFERPTLAPRINGSGSLSLLRTVMADEAGGGPLSPAMARARNQTLRLSGQLVDLANPGQLAQPLLATPNAVEADKSVAGMGVARRKKTGQVFLTNQLVTIMGADPTELLPTTTARDWRSAGTSEGHQARSKDRAQPLSEIVNVLPTPRASAAMNSPLRPGAKDTSRLEDAVAVNLLPTPTASEGHKGGPNSRGSKGDRILSGTVTHLLPTPVATPSGNTPENHLSKKPGRKVVTDLAILVENDLLESGGRLLPTPSANQATNGGSQHPEKRKAGGHQVSLSDITEHVLLPTPKASDGVFAAPSTSSRPVEKATFLSTRILLQQGHLDHRKSTGESTNPPSEDGKLCWDDPPPRRRNRRDGTGTTD